MEKIPVPHFGVVLGWNTFHVFAKQLKSKGIKFMIAPYIRFVGDKGEQAYYVFFSQEMLLNLKPLEL